MHAEALILLVPSMNTASFLTLANEMLGYSPARTADAAGVRDQTHLLACLSAFRNQSTVPSVKAARDIYDLVSYASLFVADERDMPTILETLGGMPFALTNTKVRGIQTAIASGTLRDWKIAILRGCRADQPDYVRQVFDKIYMQFCDLGLSDAFAIKTRKMLSDKTFTLES